MRTWFKRIVMGGIVFGVLVFAVMAVLSHPIDSHPFVTVDDVLVIAHRGGIGMGPENTMPAFEQSARLGADVLEMDIRCTKDGVLVVIHDRTVDRTTNGTGRVLDYTLEELEKLDAGYRWTMDDGKTYPYRGQGITIPVFKDVLNAFPDKRLNIEIKQAEPSIVEPLIRLIQDAGRADRVLIASFMAETIKEIRSMYPIVATAATAGDALLFWIMNSTRLGSAYHPAANAFQVPESIRGIPIVTENFVQGAHRHNMDVHVWTINESDEMKRLLDAGVDGIMTDYPDRLLSLLGRIKPEANTESAIDGE